LRLQGELLPAKYTPLAAEDTVEIAKIILKEEDAARFVTDHKERDITYNIEGVSRFRATVFFQRGFVGIVMRVIPLEIRSFEQLNLPVDPLTDISILRRGLVLVTGATGNGKSTTMAALIHRINQTRRAHIVTIEDPIEFLFPKEKSLVIQREVGTDTASYKQALVAAMRQDPDVIMLGEIRDAETADICLKAAETGHLVLSAIHTPDTMHTIQRLIGLFPSADGESACIRLAESLKAVISLRLLPHVDGKSRVPAVEILRSTRTIQECIRNPEKLQELPQFIHQGKELYGMQTFDDHVMLLYQQKLISLEVAKLACTNPEEFQRMLTIEA
jgi:twitching motility protein PilT